MMAYLLHSVLLKSFARTRPMFHQRSDTGQLQVHLNKLECCGKVHLFQ